jgi:RNase P/RNase MRP subunit p29
VNKGKDKINKNKKEKMKNVEILIGRKIKIVESPNKEIIGISGEVIDETKNMLIIKINKGIKKIIKKQIKIEKLE